MEHSTATRSRLWRLTKTILQRQLALSIHLCFFSFPHYTAEPLLYFVTNLPDLSLSPCSCNGSFINTFCEVHDDQEIAGYWQIRASTSMAMGSVQQRQFGNKPPSQTVDSLERSHNLPFHETRLPSNCVSFTYCKDIIITRLQTSTWYPSIL